MIISANGYAEQLTLSYKLDNLYSSTNLNTYINSIKIDYKNLSINTDYFYYNSKSSKNGITNLSLDYTKSASIIKMGITYPKMCSPEIRGYKIKKQDIYLIYGLGNINVLDINILGGYGKLNGEIILNPFSIQSRDSKAIMAGVETGRVGGYYHEITGEIFVNDIIAVSNYDIKNIVIEYRLNKNKIGLLRSDINMNYELSEKNSNILSMAGESSGNIEGWAVLMYTDLQKEWKKKSINFELKSTSVYILSNMIKFDTYEKINEYKVISMFPLFETELVEKIEEHQYKLRGIPVGGIISAKAEKEICEANVYIKKTIPYLFNFKIDNNQVTGEVKEEKAEQEHEQKHEIKWRELLLSGVTVGISYTF